ncbi:MAG: tRNA (N(6)-L-threonylcarbamoyladenosine(37)-C(2))-methylthiotransferase MtaB [Firmicutes bacterium]|nr:tRNA (N(6)-L-threonylcarbamoyladenosine(37)-C(2))-methylthiotransferase MtaB [Bacillota bacterium]
MENRVGEQRFAIMTLGCKVNQEESAAIGNVFVEHGWRQVPFGQAAEVTIINTCTVTQIAEKKSRNMLRRAVAANPDTFVAATGCYVQMKPTEAAGIEGVDLLLGANEKHRLFALAAEGAAAKMRGGFAPLVQVEDAQLAKIYREIGNINSRTERTRAFVKIEDGCNQYCSYCIVPHVRGPVRSRPEDAVLAEIAALVADGYREVVLTGIHTGAYGTDFGEQDAFARLVGKAAQVPGLDRLRMGSVEPHEVSDRLLALAVENPVICPHFHVPLQAADDRILALMGRSYDMEFYAGLLGKIRTALPDAAVTTDIIAGFPGETEEIFADSLAMIKRLAFADAHVFPYSRRPGTPAADFAEQVPNAIKNRRSAMITAAVVESRTAFRQARLGQKLTVLAEREVDKDGLRGMQGYTADYLPVFINGLTGAAGQMVTAVAENLSAEGELMAKPAE